MSKTATLISTRTSAVGAAQRHYRLSEPISDYDGNQHTDVVVSAVVAPYSGPETYIFPADENGEVVDWGELSGSFRGSLDHAQALHNAGFEVA